MSRDWTKAFFREAVFTPGSPEADAAAADEARFLWDVLCLKKGSRVLDVACGTGRHSIRLARRGANVLGVDVTPEYLRQARLAAKFTKNVQYERVDMRRLGFVRQFDAAINLWTSFGYFNDPKDDHRTLKGVARSLKPGGLFLIDTIDFAVLRKTPEKRHWARRSDGAYVLEEAKVVEGRDPRVINEWTILRAGHKPLTSRFVVRGYDKPRLYATLRKAGLEPLKTWSGLSAGYLSGSSSGKRLVILSVRS